MYKSDIAQLLDTNTRAVEAGIMFLYNEQTTDERCDGVTHHQNGRGFSACDASKGTYYAKWLLGDMSTYTAIQQRENSLDGRNHLTGYHLNNARKLCKKYAKQLLRQALIILAARPVPVSQDCDIEPLTTRWTRALPAPTVHDYDVAPPTLQSVYC